jgi:hypothetical protein
VDQDCKKKYRGLDAGCLKCSSTFTCDKLSGSTCLSDSGGKSGVCRAGKCNGVSRLHIFGMQMYVHRTRIFHNFCSLHPQQETAAFIVRLIQVYTGFLARRGCSMWPGLETPMPFVALAPQVLNVAVKLLLQACIATEDCTRKLETDDECITCTSDYLCKGVNEGKRCTKNADGKPGTCKAGKCYGVSALFASLPYACATLCMQQAQTSLSR